MATMHEEIDELIGLTRHCSESFGRSLSKARIGRAHGFLAGRSISPKQFFSRIQKILLQSKATTKLLFRYGSVVPFSYSIRFRTAFKEANTKLVEFKQKIDSLEEKTPQSFSISPVNVTDADGTVILQDQHFMDLFYAFDKIAEINFSLRGAEKAANFDGILERFVSELNETLNELSAKRTSARRFFTEISGKNEDVAQSVNSIAKILEQAQKVNEKNTEISSLIQDQEKEVISVRNQVMEFRSEVEAFKEYFEPFRKSVNDTDEKSREFSTIIEQFSEEHSEHLQKIASLENAARDALSWKQAQGLANHFDIAEKRLAKLSNTAFFSLIGSFILLAISFLVSPGWDVFGAIDATYFRNINMIFVEKEHNIISMLLYRLGFISPTIVLFFATFTIYVRLDAERKLYTYKNTLASAAINFKDIIQDTTLNEEAKNVLQATFEKIIFNPGEVQRAKFNFSNSLPFFGLRRTAKESDTPSDNS